MDNLEQYRTLIETLLREYENHKSSYGDIEIQMVLDRERDHYQVVNVGWHGYTRILGCVLYLSIKNGKIWIQHDGTEDGIADGLVALGVPKEDIVLAFHAPSMRPYTGFAVG
jgi:XisI protein